MSSSFGGIREKGAAMSLVAGLHGPTLLIQIKAFVDGIEEVGEVVVAGGVG